MKKELGLTAICALVAVVLMGVGVVSAGDIQTDGKVVSTATSGPPLAVSSTVMVDNLNADQVDGMEASEFALDGDLQSVETLLVALQAQVDALGAAPVPRTGQSTCYDVDGLVIDCGTGIGPGQDGDLQLGVTWPNPRFTKNGDGTVTDNLTGLIWLEDANCLKVILDWTQAMTFAKTLWDGATTHNGGDCGLSDGSLVGQWRIPNVRELQSLVHYGVNEPSVPNTAGTGQWVEGDPFSDLQGVYWSSTTLPRLTTAAYDVDTSVGGISSALKTVHIYVWMVRGGQ